MTTPKIPGIIKSIKPPTLGHSALGTAAIQEQMESLYALVCIKIGTHNIYPCTHATVTPFLVLSAILAILRRSQPSFTFFESGMCSPELMTWTFILG